MQVGEANLPPTLLHALHVHEYLQVGAAFVAPSGQAEQPGTAITRVPAGLAAFLLPARVSATARLSACGTLTKLAADGTAFSSYSIACKGAQHLQISEMAFKPVHGANPAGDRSVVSLTNRASPDALYSVQWQTSQAAASLSDQRAPTRSSLSWRTSAGRMQVSAEQGVVAAAARSLSFVQQQVRASASSLQLCTSSAHSDSTTGNARLPASLTGAAAIGIIRVVAQEYPATRCQQLDVSQASAQSAVDQPHQGDAFGSVLERGTLLLPLLTRQGPVKAQGGSTLR